MRIINATMAALLAVLVGRAVAVRAQPRDQAAKYAGATTGKKGWSHFS